MDPLNVRSEDKDEASFKPELINTGADITHNSMSNSTSCEKSRIKTIHPTWNIETSQDPLEANSEIQFPYEIYMQSSSLFFNMSDGNEVKSTTTKITGVYGNNFQPVHE